MLSLTAGMRSGWASTAAVAVVIRCGSGEESNGRNMGKVIKFQKVQTLRIDSSQPNQANSPKPSDPELTQKEDLACDIAKGLKELFTVEQLAEIKKDLDG